MQILFKLKTERNTRHKRWRCYIHKIKTLENFCKTMARKPDALFAYGDASFCHNSKVYSPSLKGN